MHLTVENGPLAGTSIPLDRDQAVTIGSGDDNTLQLQDPGVAAHHAVIKALKNEGFGIKTLAPGARLNGDDVEATRLRDGDRLELGGTRIGFGAPGRPRRQLGGFHLLEELGRGGMGIVYRAEQVSLNRQVAVKVLSRELTRDPVFVARFVAEARAAARLHHPNVVQVFDVDHDGDTYYYSMELMHEGSLEDWLRKNGKMPVDRAVQVIADAAAGLRYAESLRIVHRDIKPDNLMLDQHGAAKIADLGLALTGDNGGPKVTGTPHFMAPEQALRKPIDQRTDLYALGCTFYRLVTGRTPFRGSTVKDILRAQVKEDAEPAHRIEPEVPTEIGAIIQRLMEKEPDDRYQSADELLEDLETFLTPPSRRGLWIALTATAVVVAGAALTFALTREDKEPTVIEVYPDNPEARRLAVENRELKARIDYLQARLRHDDGVALAEALEAVARDHPESSVATQARAEAEGIRTEAARIARVRAEREQAIAAAATRLEDDVSSAIAASDYRRALELLEIRHVDDDLRATEPLQNAVASQRQRLQRVASEQLAALRRPVDAALEVKDPDALARALDALAPALDEKRWPRELLTDRAGLETYVREGREAVAALRSARENTRSNQAWQRYDEVLGGADAVLTAIAHLDFETAAGKVGALAGELENYPAADAANQLTDVLTRAERCVARLEAAAATGEMQFKLTDGRLMSITGFRRKGPDSGLAIQETARRTDQELVPLAALTEAHWDDLTERLPRPTAEAAADRTCFLALRSIAAHIASSRDYLGRVDRNDDDSGTGRVGYPLRPAFADGLLRRLPEAAGEPWVEFVAGELRAVQLLSAGLRALTERRNLAAAANLEQLIAEHGHSLVRIALP